MGTLSGLSPLPLLLLLLLLCLCFLSAVESRDSLFDQPRNGNAYLTREEHWFNQTLDHFSPKGHGKFSQRFYEFLDYYQASKGPIFLKICGESACNGIVNDYTSVLAKKFGAALVSLEHRYYGKSSPFKELTTDNLRFLSSKQALFDLAVFRQYYQVPSLVFTMVSSIWHAIEGKSDVSNNLTHGLAILQLIPGGTNYDGMGVVSILQWIKQPNRKVMEYLNAKYNLSEAENPWFVFGVSYSGALSAWFRLKFPHLTCGSLASSGVVLAIYNFTKFDQQVGDSAGAECKSVLQEITTLVDEQLQTDGKSVKNLFGAAKLNNNADFLYLLADAAVIAFQYGNPDVLCSPLVDAKKNGKNLLEVYANYVRDYYLGTFGSSLKSYDQEHLKNTTPGEDSADRLWWFQVCTEVAYFQVAPKNDTVRSPNIDIRYHLDLCKNVFGEGVYPDVKMTNIYYGGTRIAGSRIVFTNGSQDPWRHASKQKSTEDLPSYLIKCHNCGHGSDLRGCPQSPLNIEGDAEKCTSPEAVQKVRQQMIQHIDLWLSQCQITGDDDDEPDLLLAA